MPMRTALAGALIGVCALAAASLSAAAPPGRFADGACALVSGHCGPAPEVAVLAAFPAELAPLLAAASVRETTMMGGRVWRLGTLGGVPVVLGLLGIGLRNAETTAELVLDRFPVRAVVVSGVAGAEARIGDVTVPAVWVAPDGTEYATDPAWLDIAAAVAATPPPLERCTAVPPEPPGSLVCLAEAPTVLVGVRGRSDDPFGGRPFPCDPAGDEVSGCDVRGARAEISAVVTQDMETAAVARAAARRHIAFVAVRAVSDGHGDPLGLPGFPAQFFVYYRLAAGNAAAVTLALVERWGTMHDRIRPGRPDSGATEARAACRFERQLAPTCGGTRAPHAARRAVDRACRLLARSAADSRIAAAWRRAARHLARPAARQRLGAGCARELTAALRARACVGATCG